MRLPSGDHEGARTLLPMVSTIGPAPAPVPLMSSIAWPFVNAILRPSGDQVGSSAEASWDSGWSCLPFASMTSTSPPLVNAICLPLGDHEGEPSKYVLWVSRIGCRAPGV